jgi:nitroreductase
MQTFEAIETRRSVKHYDPNHTMPEADLQKLMSAAILSPTSFNMQNWRFVAVKNPEVREQIKGVAWGQAQVTEASLLLVLCANLNAHQESPERYWADAPKAAQDVLVPMIPKFYAGNEQLQRDEAMRSIGIASQTIMLAAKDMGYDSCPMIGFDPTKVAQIIELPEHHAIGMIITIGKALKPASVRGGQLPLSEVLFTDKF